MIDRVIVKVRCDRVRRHIVCRVLHRREGIDLLPHRQHHDAARMLSRGAPHAHAALHDAVDLARALVLPALLIVVPDIAKRRLVRQRADRPRTECLPVSKDHFRIFVRLALILPGEIQVDIRLLVSFEP